MSKIVGVTVGTPLNPAAIAEKLKPVKTVNGLAPDESGNVVIKTGGSGSGTGGFSPTVEVYKSSGGHYVYITTEEDMKSFFVSDGKDANVYIPTAGRSHASGIAEAVAEGKPVCVPWTNGRVMWLKEAKLLSDGSLDYAILSDGFGTVTVKDGATWTQEGIATKPTAAVLTMTGIEKLTGDYSVSVDFMLTGTSTDENKHDGNGDPNRDEGLHIYPVLDSTNPSKKIAPDGKEYHYIVRLSEQRGVQLIWTSNTYGDYGTIHAGVVDDYYNRIGKLPLKLIRNVPYTVKIEKSGLWLRIKAWRKDTEEEPIEWQAERYDYLLDTRDYECKFSIAHRNLGTDDEGAVISNLEFRRPDQTTFWDGATKNELTAREYFTVSGGSWGNYVETQNSAASGGVSPTVNIEGVTGGNRVTITDVNGSKFFDVFDGEDGDDGVGIASIEQTTTSTEDGGNNAVTVTLTNGVKSTFNVKNGSKGSPGKAATINGMETLMITAEDGIEVWKGVDVLTLKLGNHSQAASTITEGTFSGRVKAGAQSGDQTSSVSLLRNSKLVSGDEYDSTKDDPTVNGEIVWIYKAVK